MDIKTDGKFYNFILTITKRQYPYFDLHEVEERMPENSCELAGMILGFVLSRFAYLSFLIVSMLSALLFIAVAVGAIDPHLLDDSGITLLGFIIGFFSTLGWGLYAIITFFVPYLRKITGLSNDELLGSFLGLLIFGIIIGGTIYQFYTGTIIKFKDLGVIYWVLTSVTLIVLLVAAKEICEDSSVVRGLGELVGNKFDKICSKINYIEGEKK